MRVIRRVFDADPLVIESDRDEAEPLASSLLAELERQFSASGLIQSRRSSVRGNSSRSAAPAGARACQALKPAGSRARSHRGRQR